MFAYLIGTQEIFLLIIVVAVVSAGIAAVVVQNSRRTPPASEPTKRCPMCGQSALQWKCGSCGAEGK